MVRLFAISGLPGSGKTTAAEFFHKRGYEVINMGKLTRKYLLRGKLKENERNEKYIRNGLRKKFGEDIYARRIICDIRKNLDARGKVIIEGLRSDKELDLLRSFFPDIRLITVKASRKLRFGRLLTRTVRPLTRNQAEKRDKDEQVLLGQNKLKNRADYILDNNSSIENLSAGISRIID